MARSYLEDLAEEYCEYVKGYFVKRNVSIKKTRGRPGPDVEIDILAYDEERQIHVIYELSEGSGSWPDFVKDIKNKCNRILELNVAVAEVFFISGYAKKPRYDISAEISLLNRRFGPRGLSISYISIPDFLESVISGVKGKLRGGSSIPTIYQSLRLLELLIKGKLIL